METKTVNNDCTSSAFEGASRAEENKIVSSNSPKSGRIISCRWTLLDGRTARISGMGCILSTMILIFWKDCNRTCVFEGGKPVTVKLNGKRGADVHLVQGTTALITTQHRLFSPQSCNTLTFPSYRQFQSQRRPDHSSCRLHHYLCFVWRESGRRRSGS